MATAAQQQRAQKTLKDLLQNVPDNRTCFTCTQKGPTYILGNGFNVFVCQKCSGLCRNFNWRVKGVSMCNFTDEEVMTMKSGGNGLAREIWLARWSPQKLPVPNPGDEAAILRFMKLVFVKQAFKSGEELPQTVPIEKIMGKEKLPALEVGKPTQQGKRPDFEWEDDPFVTPPQQQAPVPSQRQQQAPPPAHPGSLLDPGVFTPVQLQPVQQQQAPQVQAPPQQPSAGLAGFDFGKPMQPTIPGQAQPQLGGPQPGFGMPQLAPQPGFGQPQPGFGQPQPGFGMPQPGFGQPQPGMQQAQLLAYQQQLYQQQLMLQQMLAAQGQHPPQYQQPMQQPIIPRSQPATQAPDPFAGLRNNLENM